MKKVLIISYYFPPANFVGAERTEAWAKHLHKSGYYPIILTRCWNEGQTDPMEQVLDNSQKLVKHENYEVHYVSLKNTWRNKLHNKKGWIFLKKMLSFLEILFANFSVNSSRNRFLYLKAKELLKSNQDMKIVIASGRPFYTFFIGYKLKKEFPITWIPDYRDEWNTHKSSANQGALWKVVSKIERKSELKWTSNADGFLSVSKQWIESIKEFIDKPGYVVMNGYQEFKDSAPNVASSNGELHLLYAGTVYPSQNLNILIQAIKELSNTQIYLTFIGVETIQEERRKLENLCAELGERVRFYGRMPRVELEKFIDKTDVMVLTSFENVKGWYPVKLFEYYASSKPILLVPSDEGEMEAFIKTTNSGVVANAVDECKSELINFMNLKKEKGFIIFERNLEEGRKYSREFQTSILGETLDKF